MSLETEKAQIMWKLTRKNNWGACYDRLEHFKRFPNIDLAVKELIKMDWILMHKKQNYKAISLNPRYKREIIEFIESKISGLRDDIR